jgi:hypothetical protein
MSTVKNSLSKVGGVEIMTGINTVGLVYTYYELNKLGADVNKRLIMLSSVIKKLNNNVNVINQHFIKHLYHHKTILDIDDQTSISDASENNNLLAINENILARLKELENKVLELESISNPLLTEKACGKKVSDSSPKQTYNGKDTEPLF